MQKDRSRRRYKLAEKIGAGAFATVFAANDRKLNREVAIKQLHEQYLSDKDQLERYWQEAQLLGSLDHPNIMTIFDVVRSKGCLVLERMQGSLQQIYGKKPMPVNDVRQTIIQVANGLKCLHENGIIHGDVKPGNLFLSRQDVVKLGDFGLARRANDGDGSLVKGTTRYMAPELVSEEFGDVGPASDLYSLGFSALELLVGPEFESLFPDLIAFGRDRQMAWMMWHCSPDRKLPPVQSLLEGVPDDLANVLQKLTAKDQTQRYKSAQEVLLDLSGDATPVGQSLKDEAAAAEEEARKKKKKRRIIAAFAGVASLLMSFGIWWAVQEPPAPPERKVPAPVRGIVQNVLPLDQKLVLDIGADWKEFKLLPKDDVSLNRNERQLRDLEPGDRVVVYTRLEPEGKSRYEIIAFRPTKHTGEINDVRPDENTFVLKVTEGDDVGKEFLLAATPETPIKLNEMSTSGNQTMTVASLAPGDRVIVEHSDDETGMLALSVIALRDVSLSGYVRKIESRSITIALEEAEKNTDSFVRIPLAADCVFELNGLTSIDQRLVRVDDIQPGDKVTLEHDTKVKSIKAYRVYPDRGAIVKLDYEGNTFTIDSESTSSKTTYSIEPTLKLMLGDEQVQFTDLRLNDRVMVSHDSPGDSTPVVDSFTATRPADPNKWVILIGNQSFNDKTIAPLTTAINNVNQLRDVLVKRYAVPDDQLLVCEDFERVRLEQDVSRWIAKVPSGAELYVYVTTRAYAVPGENVYLASKDSIFDRLDESGLKFDWLIDQLDQSATVQKILLLDCTHPDSKSDPNQVSTTEMIELVRDTHRGGYPRSVYVLGSSEEGQTPVNMENENRSLFATALANAFGGAADQARDNKLEITELTDYVKKSVQRQAKVLNVVQRPTLILPDATPPRISAAAKQAVIGLLSRFSDDRVEIEQVSQEAFQADKIAKGQPEPMLAYGLLLIKAPRMDDALEVLEGVRLKHPRILLAHQAVIWLHYYKSRYDAGFAKLQGMLGNIPVPEEMETPYSEETLKIFEWAGRLREFAAMAEWSRRQPTAAQIKKFDDTVATYGVEPMKRFQKGRDHVQKVAAEFDAEFAISQDPLVESQKRRLRSYVDSIANIDSMNSIRGLLDQ